ncbi:CDP-glucose 4,6-dehydratase [Marinoscillum pacificum]|uniref:CDP-glucose 4,6-dehydratase n=1 Tax=Marinoscillum pacificum TaxID=392723 RepID=UPI0021581E50|nr:CDP-glucose 4,6-dehydratase [Marinoscillum pacificum]
MNKEQIQLIQSSYKGKKVFLTGHTGFKGSWLLYWLKQLGAEVKGYALHPDQSESLYNSMNGDSMCDSVIADIRNKDRLSQEIKEYQPDFVFHLAAQPLVRLSYEIPAETFEVNAVGTANVLDGIRHLKKSCIGVMITTDKVYENKEWHHPYRESDQLGGYDPYSASKACTELVISSYRNSFLNPYDYQNHHKSIVSARAGNVIGGGDWAKDRIIPDIVKALIGNRSIEVRNPKAVRPWQHVLEPLGGYLLLGAMLLKEPVKHSYSWNFGPQIEDNLDVESLVQTAIKVWGTGKYETQKQINQPHEAGLLKLDISKAMAELNWKPKWSAETTIEKTLSWYKKRLNGVSASELLESDINSYSTN